MIGSAATTVTSHVARSLLFDWIFDEGKIREESCDTPFFYRIHFHSSVTAVEWYGQPKVIYLILSLLRILHSRLTPEAHDFCIRPQAKLLSHSQVMCLQSFHL